MGGNGNLSKPISLDFFFLLITLIERLRVFFFPQLLCQFHEVRNNVPFLAPSPSMHMTEHGKVDRNSTIVAGTNGGYVYGITTLV